VITAYGALLAVTFGSAMGGLPFEPGVPLVAATSLLGAGTAVYTAFLFGQSKGRDLWQSPLLAPHLVVQALVAGAALFAFDWLRWLLPLNGLLVAGEIWGRHPTEDARRAAHLVESDLGFTGGVLLVGHVVPLAILWAAPASAPVAGGLALAGLFAWEHLYVQAPQKVALA
jgi:hypothetical protein